MNQKLTTHPPSFFRRGLAYLIDSFCAFVFVAVTQLLFFSPIRSLFGIDTQWFHSGINTQLYTILTISIPVWLYFALCDGSKWRATIGKHLMNLQVVEFDSNSRISFSRSLMRTIIKLLPWELAHIGNNLPVPVWYAEEPDFRIAFAFSGILMVTYIVSMFTNPNRKCIHDLVTGTNIVSTRVV